MALEPEVLFFFDSDALIQVLLTIPELILPTLSSEFGVRCLMMNEVEIEVRSNRKIGANARLQLDKALKTKSLRLLTSSDLENLAAEGSAPMSLADIREIGRDYSIHVGLGEAYSHAAGVLLNCPVVSNDMNAIRTLEANDKPLPPTILRSWDIFEFLYSEGCLSPPAAERLLKTLKQSGEWVPRCFEHASFEDGRREYHCRLGTSLAIAASVGDWSATLYLKRVLRD